MKRNELFKDGWFYVTKWGRIDGPMRDWVGDGPYPWRTVVFGPDAKMAEEKRSYRKGFPSRAEAEAYLSRKPWWRRVLGLAKTQVLHALPAWVGLGLFVLLVWGLFACSQPTTPPEKPALCDSLPRCPDGIKIRREAP